MSAPGSDGGVESLKRKREEESAAVSAPTPAASAAETTAAAPKKKRRWDTNDAATSVPAAAPVPVAAAPVTATSVQSAAERAAALQKSVGARLAALKALKAATPSASPPAVKVEGGVAPVVPAGPVGGAGYFPSPTVVVKDESKSWMPLRLDALGRQVDEHGAVISLARPTELKANIRDAASHAAAGAPKEKLSHVKISTTIYKSEGQSKFFDPRMRESGPPERKARATMEFVKPGKYIAQAATMRMKQLEKDMAAAAASTSSSAAMRDAAAHTAVAILKPAAIPAVEWWDTKLLKDASAYPASPSLLADAVSWDRVTSFVYHPVEVDSLTTAPPPPPMPVLLTKKERMKIKKRTKREELKEARDRVRLGIDAPAEPKMRIQNLMNVLLNDTVADPSLMESRVRAQMAQRVEGHLEANASRKLTSEQKAEKRRRKYLEDTSHEVHVAVYRAGDLADGKSRYQIDINAQQWNLAGVAVLHPDCTVVVVEGGPKNQRRFRRLMLHRIRWKRRRKGAMEQAEADAAGEHQEEDDDDDDDSDDESDAGFAASDATTRSRTGACALLWSGIIPKTRFPSQRFTFENCRSEAMARSYLAKMDMANYWDMCRAHTADSEL